MDPDLLYSKVGDEIVLLTLESGKYFKIDAIGSRIWELIKQPLTFDQLCHNLLEEFDASPGQIQTDVELFLNRCLDDHLILVD